MNKLVEELKKKLDEMLEREDDSFEFSAEFIRTCLLYITAKHYNINDVEEARKKVISLLKKSLQRKQS